MNKKMTIMAGVLALSMLASSAVAASAAGNGVGNGNGKDKASKPNKQGTQIEITVEAEDEGTTVTDSVYGNGKGKGTVTDAVYGKGGAHGLENAYKNTKGKPSGDRIAELLLTKYGIDVTAEKASDADALAAELETQGNIEAAAEVQVEIVLAAPADLDNYKKLGKLKKKLGKKGIATFVNGEEQQFDAAPMVKNGRTLVPFRAISASLKADVNYDSASKTVTVTREDVVVKLTLGSKTALVNGKEVTLDVPAETKNGRVFVPMRFLSETLQAEVMYESESQSVIVLDASISAGAQAAAGEQV
jgi:hypothetical protein